MNSLISNNIKIFEKNLVVMTRRIIEIEKNNLKTKALTDAEIKGKIRSIIIEEANKNY